jgi:hypothetical protein
MSLHNLQLFPTTSTPRIVQLLLTTVLVLFTSAAFGQVLTLTPSLSLSESYDDNIFETDTDEETDFITTITPGILLRYQPLSNTLLNLDYRADIQLFAKNTEENQVGQRGTLRFTSPITPFLSIALSDTLIFTEEPGDRTLEIDQQTGLRSVSQESRQRTIRNLATANLDILLTARSTLGFLFESLIENVEDPDELDEFRNTVGVELGYLTDVSRGNRIRLFYDLTFHTFSENPSSTVDPQPSFQVHSINMGYRHTFSPTFSGDVAVGYSITTSDSSTAGGDSGFVTNIGLTRTLRNGSIAFRYRRNFTSGGGEGGVVMADVFTLTVASGLTPKITASLGSNLSFFNFLEEEEDDEDRMFLAIRPNLTYEILRFWRLSLVYEFAFTNFDSSANADRFDHRFTFASQFTVRESLFLSLTYQSRIRKFGGGTIEEGDQEFNRNAVMLTLTYAPTFLFGR